MFAHTTRRRLTPFVPLVTLAVASAVACSRSSDFRRSEAGDSEPRRATALAETPAPSGLMARDAAPAVETKVAATEAVVDAQANQATAASAQAVANAIPTPSTIIRTGTASVQVDSLDRALSALQQVATSLGGWVGNSSLAAGNNQVRSASVELKIPVTRYDDALRGLQPLGKVETVSSTVEDVGEEFVDLNARIANSHRLEERLIALLANRTGKLQDALAVEHELARVREEIERQEGRLRFLKSRVAMSTLTVSLHEPFPIVGDNPGASPISNAFKEAWRNFVNFTAVAIASLGTLIPIGGILVALWILIRRRRRGMAKAVA